MTSLPRTPDGRVSLRPEDYPPKGYGKGGFFDISPQPPKYYDPLATPFPSSPTQPPGPITGGSFPTQQRLPRWQTQEEQYYEQPQSNEVVGTGYSAGQDTVQFGKGGGAPTYSEQPQVLTPYNPNQPVSPPVAPVSPPVAPVTTPTRAQVQRGFGDDILYENSIGQLEDNIGQNEGFVGQGFFSGGGSIGRQMAGGGSTYTSEPPMSGLSSVLAMQGRLGDSTLVHMNPMEVEMLKTMSPDGNLSYNPETGLPEAFKLRDIAAFALPIAAGIAAPYLLPTLGGVTAGAIGAGVGGFGSGLIQGKGVGDSLVQGGLSGLMSYGMGSMMAPSTVTGGSGAIQGGTTAAPIVDVTGAEASMKAGAGMMAPSNTVLNVSGGLPVAGAVDPASIATLNQSIGPPAGTPTSSFTDIGFGPEDSVQYTGATDEFVPGTGKNMLGRAFDRASRTSPFGPTAFGNTLGPTQVPTYTQIGGSALGSAGQMYMDSMLSPEEMPYDIADDEDYYDADLEGGRLRGRANARTLKRPFESIDPSEYYDMATSPGGIGTFYAADGGRVPFEGTVPGAGTGMSDDVPFSIEGDQPALLSRDEYVLPADVVSQLGDGSSGAGSDMLDNFISQVRHTKYGNTQQPPPVGPELMIELMRSGGIV